MHIFIYVYFGAFQFEVYCFARIIVLKFYLLRDLRKALSYSFKMI